MFDFKFNFGSLPGCLSVSRIFPVCRLKQYFSSFYPHEELAVEISLEGSFHTFPTSKYCVSPVPLLARR
jgi:hypothetical protein